MSRAYVRRVYCPYCGSDEALDYRGVDEGGDYGTEICDIWYCGNCDHDFEDSCIEGYSDDE